MKAATKSDVSAVVAWASAFMALGGWVTWMWGFWLMTAALVVGVVAALAAFAYEPSNKDDPGCPLLPQQQETVCSLGRSFLKTEARRDV